MAQYDQFMLTTVSAEAAENLLDAYYTALQGSRHTIASYYCATEKNPDGKSVPTIVWNGNVMNTGQEVQQTFEVMPYTHYDVQSLDCHVLNPTALAPEKVVGGSGEADKDIERRLSIVAVVNGSVRLEEPKEGPLRGFSETFVLVPNPEKALGKGPKAELKGWLIQNQNFRYTV
ncbi:putative nuclear transport factor 2 domain protein [Lepidopterella palustris CBS 459.81]|uniref:Putative nuclear transport factor 2 domain protein n=1 Tax=Lepidopterella palustris CBS 459.81 TaxID=1314670 RepID=A0A8E2E4F4_9PEZI|nr:putative nuclear transport factor 2 domain protein [Lepidopterella palustris CBS 459.81]